MEKCSHLLELIYLICFKYWDTRASFSDEVMDFLDREYSNPSIGKVIVKIQEINEANRLVLVESAKNAFINFHRLMNDFLGQEIQVGEYAGSNSVKQLFLGNFHRVPGNLYGTGII